MFVVFFIKIVLFCPKSSEFWCLKRIPKPDTIDLFFLKFVCKQSQSFYTKHKYFFIVSRFNMPVNVKMVFAVFNYRLAFPVLSCFVKFVN